MSEENKIIEILKSSDKVIFKNIDLLIQQYEEKTGKKVNTGCSSCIRVMILTLKNIFKMVNFKLKRNAASYKNKKGDKTTISNSTMTDEKAIEFLKTNPKRIELFSEFPSNWKKLTKGETETEEQKEARLAAEAEAIEAAKEKAKKDSGSDLKVLDSDKKEETEEQKEARLAAEAEKGDSNDSGSDDFNEDELLKMSLSDLRAKYPTVKATSIRAFIDKVKEL